MPDYEYLTEAEYDLLDEFLDTKTETCGGIPGVSWLDGYLTAVILAPEKIAPAEWLPLVWSDGENEQLPFDGAQEEAQMCDLVMRHYQALAHCISEKPQAVEPILLASQDDPELPDLSDWAAGFMDGLALLPERWQELIDAPEGRLLLMPIFLYGTESGQEELEKDSELNDPLLFCEELPQTIEEIRDFWRKQQSEPAARMEKRGRRKVDA